MKVPFFVPAITNEDKQHVVKSMSQQWLTNGMYLKKFEHQLSSFINTKFAIGVGSATQALHLATRAMNISPKDEVIVPTFTFAATANSVIYCGGKLIFTDVESDTFNISVDSIKKKISPRTKAIIPVHYGGQSCNMDEIRKIANDYNLYIIEDCAHALGSTFKNKMCGNLGDIGCFSFYPTKIITTGEGGMITTNNKNFFQKISILRSQGMNMSALQREKNARWRYDITDLGYNYRLDEIRASLGFSQFKRLNKINKKRISIAKKYTKLLKNIKGIITPTVKANRNHIFHLYTIKVNNDYHISRDELFLHLNRHGIGTSVQFYPLHLMSYYKKFKFKKSDFPNSNKLKDQVLSLPIFPGMSDKQIEYVVSQIK